MCTEYAQEPLYLSVARWVMQQQRWVSAREIAQQFDLSTCKAINTVSYILSGVEEITCQTKTIQSNSTTLGIPVLYFQSYTRLPPAPTPCLIPPP